MRHTATLLAVALGLFWTATLVSGWPSPWHRDDHRRVRLDYRINVNAANAATLELLPGIGPNIARSMVEYRGRGNRFRTVTDLQRVPRIGPVTAKRIEPWIRFRAVH